MQIGERQRAGPAGQIFRKGEIALFLFIAGIVEVGGKVV
jgi:hypothetical protein